MYLVKKTHTHTLDAHTHIKDNRLDKSFENCKTLGFPKQREVFFPPSHCNVNHGRPRPTLLLLSRHYINRLPYTRYRIYDSNIYRGVSPCRGVVYVVPGHKPRPPYRTNSESDGKIIRYSNHTKVFSKSHGGPSLITKMPRPSREGGEGGGSSKNRTQQNRSTLCHLWISSSVNFEYSG